MASTILRANQFRRVPGDGEANSNVKSGDTFTFDSGSELVIASGATLTTSGTLAIGAGATLTSPVIVTPTVTDLTEVVITTNVITAAETGKTFFLDLVGGFTSTLPAPAAGLRFKFVVKTAPTTSYVITTNAGANVLYGLIDALGAAAEANGVKGQAQDTVNLVANQAVIGDFLDFISDGTNWYVSGAVAVVAGATFAVT